MTNLCRCGHSFPESLGKFGCPNCNGDAMTPTDGRERQARSRQARAEAGGKQIAVMLTPAADAKLALWIARGESISSTVNRLLSKSRP